MWADGGGAVRNTGTLFALLGGAIAIYFLAQAFSQMGRGIQSAMNAGVPQ